MSTEAAVANAPIRSTVPTRLDGRSGRRCIPECASDSPGQPCDLRRQTRRASHTFASRRRREQGCAPVHRQGGEHPADVPIDEGAHVMKPSAMLLIGGSPPPSREAFGADSLRVARRCGPTGALPRPSCPPISGTICATQLCPGARKSAGAQIAEFSRRTRRRRISSCTSVRALNLQMQTSCNTDCLPGESEHRRG